MHRTLLPALILVLAGPAGAANLPATHSLFTGLLASAHHFDGDTGLDDTLDTTATLGFRFSDGISVELAAGRSSANDETDRDVDVDTAHLDALWHYARGDHWQRYLVAGAGQQSVDAAGTDHNTGFITGGIGVFRSIGRPFLLRLEGRWLYDLDEEQAGLRLSAGITAAFGGQR